MTDAATIDGTGRAGAPFPFRDLLVARTYEHSVDAAATLVVRALGERMAGVAVIRADGDSLTMEPRHAVLIIVGSPMRRSSAAMPRGDASVLARRPGIPVVVAPPRVAPELAGLRTLACGVRDDRDAACVALAGALDLQHALLHLGDPPASISPPLDSFRAATARAQARSVPARRSMVAVIAARAGRATPRYACMRTEGPVGLSLRRAGIDENAALVAVGAPHRRPLAAAAFGSVARYVARSADRSVLVCLHEPALALRA